MPAKASPLDDEIRGLYQGPLSEFTPSRQALLKRLAKEGNARADEVKALRKPVPSGWAVNQLFAREPRAMAAFLGAIEAAAEKGGGVLRDALESVRGEAGRLTAVALELMARTEGAPGPAVGDRVRKNLEALAHDPAHRASIERGWLDVDLDPPGFEVMAALQLAAEKGRSSGAPLPSPGLTTASAKKSNPAAQAAAKREARERQERIQQAREELAKIEARAVDLRRAADEAGATAHTATRAAAAAEQAAEQARRAATEAKRHADAAATELTRAREALRGLERS